MFWLLASAGALNAREVLHIAPSVWKGESTTTSDVAEPTQSLDSSAFVASKTSLIDEYFAYQQASQSPEVSYELVIDIYDDALADPNNLKLWTKKVAAKQNRYTDIDYRKYGPGAVPGTKARSIIDIDDFIQFLVSQKNMNETDLSFLKEDLDYGLEEIERELNKIRNKGGSSIIDIGGENGKTISNATRVLVLLLWVSVAMALAHI